MISQHWVISFCCETTNHYLCSTLGIGFLPSGNKHLTETTLAVILHVTGYHSTIKRFLSCNDKYALRWRHNRRDSVSNHQPHDCLLNSLFRRRSKKTSKLRVIGLCAGNSPGTGEFPAQMACDAENVSIWWRHHDDRSSTVLSLTHPPLVPHIYVSELGHLWFR